jgi:hypothetical protein
LFYMRKRAVSQIYFWDSPIFIVDVDTFYDDIYNTCIINYEHRTKRRKLKVVKYLLNFITKITSPKTIVVFLVLFIVAMVLVNFTFSSGVQNLTQTFNYTPEEAYQMIEEYGESGRAKHLGVLLMDPILVVLYTILFSCSILFTVSRLFISKTALYKLSIAPFILASIQTLEIVGLFIIIRNFPIRHILLVKITNIVTMAKIILTYFCVFLSLIGFLGLLMKKVIALIKH